MQIRTITPELAGLKQAALALIQELDGIGMEIEDRLGVALERAWRLGVKLLRAKELLGHGKWMLWVENNLPISDRHARRHMELAQSNPQAKSVAELSEESVRKFRLGYVPEKERPELAGDQALPRTFHHLTLINDWKKLQRRLEIGQAHLDQVAARKDLWPLFEWLGGLYGLNAETFADLRPPR